MRKLLVPTDFTEIAENALNQACYLAKVGGSEVVALNVVAKRDQVNAAKAKADELAAAKSKEHGVHVEGAVRIGNIFEGIGQAASELNVSLIVMGTHGMKGLQYLTGSHAMKVITGSATPFIIVQGKAVAPVIKNIVMAIDLNQESKQMLGFGVDIARLFNSKIHLFSIRQSDLFHKTALNRNVGYAKEYLAKERVNFGITIQDDAGNSFAKDVLAYAKSVDSELLAIVNFEDDQIFTTFGSSYEQHMITNSE